MQDLGERTQNSIEEFLGYVIKNPKYVLGLGIVVLLCFYICKKTYAIQKEKNNIIQNIHTFPEEIIFHIFSFVGGTKINQLSMSINKKFSTFIRRNHMSTKEFVKSKKNFFFPTFHFNFLGFKKNFEISIFKSVEYTQRDSVLDEILDEFIQRKLYVDNFDDLSNEIPFLMTTKLTEIFPHTLTYTAHNKFLYLKDKADEKNELAISALLSFAALKKENINIFSPLFEKGVFKGNMNLGNNIYVTEIKLNNLKSYGRIWIDFSLSNFLGSSLENCFFQNIRFKKSNLSFSKFNNSIFKWSDLEKVNFVGSELTNTDLSYCYLRKVDLSFANLSGSKITNSDLTKSNLSSANLSGTNFENTNLENANLTNTNLNNCNLNGTNLIGVVGIEKILSSKKITIKDSKMLFSDYKKLYFFNGGKSMSWFKQSKKNGLETLKVIDNKEVITVQEAERRVKI